MKKPASKQSTVQKTPKSFSWTVTAQARPGQIRSLPTGSSNCDACGAPRKRAD